MKIIVKIVNHYENHRENRENHRENRENHRENNSYSNRNSRENMEGDGFFSN